MQSTRLTHADWGWQAPAGGEDGGWLALITNPAARDWWSMAVGEVQAMRPTITRQSLAEHLNCAWGKTSRMFFSREGTPTTSLHIPP